ncbi:hypothetical protein BCR43DRAFT_129417 [Syncephalastrum racemosum]|uniref:Homeobox domain-containing protein n=1 Tax=Syncephalastrum racemosum TaxID=13706 RepID=A0A1X2HL42_SYNRA|nr:hypothetical protein BCR43DRAFT_129417 [Syncephalastrum racemosum]
MYLRNHRESMNANNLNTMMPCLDEQPQHMAMLPAAAPPAPAMLPEQQVEAPAFPSPFPTSTGPMPVVDYTFQPTAISPESEAGCCGYPCQDACYCTLPAYAKDNAGWLSPECGVTEESSCATFMPSGGGDDRSYLSCAEQPPSPHPASMMMYPSEPMALAGATHAAIYPYHPHHHRQHPYTHPVPHHAQESMNRPHGSFRPSFYNPFEVKHRKRTTRSQLKVLERTFREHPKPNADLRRLLAHNLNMTPRGVQVWFQNRRAKVKAQRRKAAATAAEEAEEDDDEAVAEEKEQHQPPPSSSSSSSASQNTDLHDALAQEPWCMERQNSTTSSVVTTEDLPALLTPATPPYPDGPPPAPFLFGNAVDALVADLVEPAPCKAMQLPKAEPFKEDGSGAFLNNNNNDYNCYYLSTQVPVGCSWPTSQPVGPDMLLQNDVLLQQTWSTNDEQQQQQQQHHRLSDPIFGPNDFDFSFVTTYPSS